MNTDIGLSVLDHRCRDGNGTPRTIEALLDVADGNRQFRWHVTYLRQRDGKIGSTILLADNKYDSLVELPIEALEVLGLTAPGTSCHSAILQEVLATYRAEQAEVGGCT